MSDSSELARSFDKRRVTLEARRKAFAHDAPEENVRRLSQKDVHQALSTVSRQFWAAQASTRVAVQTPYWELLRTIKLIADDVFVETLGVIERAATPTGTAGSQYTREDVARSTYRETLKVFARASPFLFRDPRSRSLPLYSSSAEPRKRFIGFEGLAHAGPFGITGQQYVIDVAAALASRTLEASLAAHDASTVTPPPELKLDTQGLHALGITYLLLQLYLVELAILGGPPVYSGWSWYQQATEGVDWLRNQVLGALFSKELKAILTNKPASPFQAGRNRIIAELTHTYAVRSEETAALWAFRRRRIVKRRAEVFGLARIIVGVNEAEESLMSYLGRPDPDGDKDRDRLDVDALLRRATELNGTQVTVHGEIDAKRPFLRSFSERDVSVALDGDAAELFWAQRKGRQGVDATGTFMRDPKPAVIYTQLAPFAEGYPADVAIPTGIRRPSTTAVALSPSWRTMTGANERQLIAERGVESVFGSVVRQQDLVGEVLRIPGVVAALKRSGKKPGRIQLTDLEIRGIVWAAAFAEFHRSDADTALGKLLALQQSYLTAFTRHTLWNVRDRGRDYFRTKWPTDISGQSLFDCGVYVVLTAYDIFRAVNGISNGPLVEFAFVTYLNHIALAGFTNGQTFFVNNDRVHGPEPIPADLPPGRVERARFELLRWGRQGFAATYPVRYSIAPLRAPHQTISTSRADRSFRTRLWADYQRVAVWWGLRTGIAGSYHEWIRDYNVKMEKLEALLGKKDADTKAGSKTMLEAATLAVELFKTADELASERNMGARPEFKGRILFERAVGVVHPQAKEPPLYRVVRLLQAAKRRGETLSGPQQQIVDKPSTADAHAGQLFALPK